MHLNAMFYRVSIIWLDLDVSVLIPMGLVLEVRALTEMGRHCYHIGPKCRKKVWCHNMLKQLLLGNHCLKQMFEECCRPWKERNSLGLLSTSMERSVF